MGEIYQDVYGNPTNQKIALRVLRECVRFLNDFGIPASLGNTKIEQRIGETRPDWTERNGTRIFREENSRNGVYIFNTEYTSQHGKSIALCGVEYHKEWGVIIRTDSVSFDSGGMIQ